MLAVFNHLPAHMRVVSQLALVPVPPTWSRLYRRKSVEHPLEQERLRARYEMSAGMHPTGPSTLQLVAMGALVAVLLIWLRFKHQLDSLFPLWLRQAALSVLHGKPPSLSPAQVLSVEIAGSLTVVALFCLAFAVLQIRKHMGTTPIYDMRLVDEKTARPAYRVRLRLFVFSSQIGTPATRDVHCSERLVQCFTRQPFGWPWLMDAYRDWRESVYQHKQSRQEQAEVLDHLVAAYRQFHTASGGYFVSRRVSQKKARRLLLRRKGWLRSPVSGWEHDLARSSHVLSAADLAALWHLPQAQDLADLPYVEPARARTARAPAELTLGQAWNVSTSSHVGR